MAHIFNPSTQEAEVDESELQDSVIYTGIHASRDCTDPVSERCPSVLSSGLVPDQGAFFFF